MDPEEQARRTLRVLREASEPGMTGLEICAAIEAPTGTIHATLARLERAGKIVSSWEQMNPQKNRPRRRYYRLPPGGRDCLMGVHPHM